MEERKQDSSRGIKTRSPWMERWCGHGIVRTLKDFPF
jgi:hypothetical protein